MKSKKRQIQSSRKTLKHGQLKGSDIIIPKKKVKVGRAIQELAEKQHKIQRKKQIEALPMILSNYVFTNNKDKFQKANGDLVNPLPNDAKMIEYINEALEVDEFTSKVPPNLLPNEKTQIAIETKNLITKIIMGEEIKETDIDPTDENASFRHWFHGTVGSKMRKSRSNTINELTDQILGGKSVRTPFFSTRKQYANAALNGIKTIGSVAIAAVPIVGKAGRDHLNKKIIKAGKKSQKLCSFNKRRSNISNIFSSSSFDEIARITKKHKFFEKEDEYFKALLIKNFRTFCTKRNKGEFLFFCKNIITHCLRTPRDLQSLLYDLTDPEQLRKQFKKTSYPKEKTLKKIIEANADEFARLIEGGKIKTKEDILALMFVYLREENIQSFAAFLKDVIIQTIIEYLNPEIKKPAGIYTGKIIMKPYIDDIIKLINKSESNIAQEGGKRPQGKVSLADTKKQLVEKGFKDEAPLSAGELNKITEDDLVEGIKKCDKKDIFSEAKDLQQTKINEGVAGDDYSNSNSEFSSLSESIESTSFLYTIFGCFLLVATIEFGLFDAPPCMSHTIF